MTNQSDVANRRAVRPLQSAEKSHLVIGLVHRLNEVGSWSGATHIQKSAFFLQEWRQAPLNYRFVIHYYGPYSFDLDEELGLLRTAGWLKAIPQDGWGVRYEVEPQRLAQVASSLSERDWADINAVADRFGRKNARQLEVLATVYMFMRTRHDASLNGADQWVKTIKPHVGGPDIQRAWNELLELQADASSPTR